MTASCAVLWGREHTELGAVESASLGDGVGLAITRGRHRKSYYHVDENEDVAAACRIGARLWLVVADGHYGHEASHEAVAAVLAAVEALPAEAEVDRATLLDVFVAAQEAVVARTQAPGFRNIDSRTALTVAVLEDGSLAWGAMGDCALYLVGGRGSWRVGMPRRLFVGWPMTRADLSWKLGLGREDVAPDVFAVLASDGFCDFADVEAALARFDGSRPEEAAARLVEAAGDGGAGDNVAVVVARAGG